MAIIFIVASCTAREKTVGLEAEKNMFKNIRQPVVAGGFYPANTNRLSFKIKEYLKAAEKNLPSAVKEMEIKAIIAPHAGYDFSGPVAAHSYATIDGQKFDTVIIICNSHTAYFPGIAVDDHDAWQTPLGTVVVNKELAEKIVKSSDVIRFNNQVHLADHSLEVQLPFLQTVLSGDFKIVPILFGNIHNKNYEELAKILAHNLGPHDLIVVSTDMSHYPAYDDAVRIDRQTLAAIASGSISLLEEHIQKVESEGVPNEETLLCGIDGVKTIMSLSRMLDWNKIEILHYANSGDVPISDKDRVVGYGAVAFGQSKIKEQNEKNSQVRKELNNEQKKELLHIIRQTVETFVRTGKVPEFKVIDERLNWKEGVFVTLHKNGQLRGCIGQIIPTDKPLWQVARDMAVAACSQDNRFSPVTEDELPQIDYEVSVLSRPEPINDWRKIELGKHGVIVKRGFHSGVFLPQVANETGWSREEFLSQLCWQKAGLPPDCYHDKDTELEVFTAQVFSEKDIK